MKLVIYMLCLLWLGLGVSVLFFLFEKANERGNDLVTWSVLGVFVIPIISIIYFAPMIFFIFN